ncbi:hypothetical protein [Acutalibacter muris]|uniref:hypothetical protein n=1 Tax=Acutalibacter muris TaxID=1796620 RepID=UPI001C3F9E66|nr:hypothetical protein [Acutalibacter muris]
MKTESFHEIFAHAFTAHGKQQEKDFFKIQRPAAGEIPSWPAGVNLGILSHFPYLRQQLFS